MEDLTAALESISISGETEQQSNDNNAGPSPHSLPKLNIGSYSGPSPEEVPLAQAIEFIVFCHVHRRAPITILPTLPEAPEEGEEHEDAQAQDIVQAPNKYDEWLPVPESMAFTRLDQDEIDQRNAIIRETVPKHTAMIEEMNRDHSDKEVMAECRRLAAIREVHNKEIGIIYDKRRMRRQFRREFNRLEPGW